MNDAATAAGLVRIYFPNGSFHSLKYTKNSLISLAIGQDIVSIVIRGRINPNTLAHYRSCYALRVVRESGGGGGGNETTIRRWLQSDFTMQMVDQRLPDRQSWRFELRIRFFPDDLRTMMNQDLATFNYLYDQLKHDYILMIAKSTDPLPAIRLGCLDIRKLSFHLSPPRSSATTATRKINVDFIEKELGLANFFPENLLTGGTTKIRTLRKLIKTQLKELENMDESTCMLNYIEILSTVWHYDQEKYKCVTDEAGILTIDPRTGITFFASHTKMISRLCSFRELEKVTIVGGSADAKRVQLKTVSKKEIVLTFDSSNIASSVTYLLDGYCSLFSSSSSSSRNQSTSLRSERRENMVAVGSDREMIEIVSVIGQGNFGEVYRGMLTQTDGEVISVAVKTCKENDATATELFMSEAGIMQRFHHPHIIRVYAVCPSNPVMIIMELAELGELRRYLKTNGDSIRDHTLTHFCTQLARALEFLETNKFVHRDIAARNILVTGPECIKLADFGLSRELEKNPYYRASKGKLPVRWMAPESINFRTFTHSSDVWMFGVCMWEIMARGVKPFQGVSNSRVIEGVEAGLRLPRPPNCSDQLYDMMNECWQYEAEKRPTFNDLSLRLSDLLARSVSTQEKQQEIEQFELANDDEGEDDDDEQKLPVKAGYTVIGLDYALICDLHNKAKEIVGAVLSLNVAASNQIINSRDVILQAKFVGCAVRDFIGTIDVFAQNLTDEHVKLKLVESQEQIAEEMREMIEHLRSSSIGAVLFTSVKIAKISKSMFENIQSQFFCLSTV